MTLWAVVLITALTVIIGCASDLERRFQAHIDYLASDELEGRGIGTHGIQLAADYIAEQFAEVGLESTAPGGGYFHTVTMAFRRSLTRGGRLDFGPEGEALVQGEDYLPLPFSSNEVFDAKVVFCGYGLVAEDKGRDDFVHVDLTGRAALMFRGFPPSWNDDEVAVRRSAMLRTKVYNAKDRGALAVIFVNQAPDGVEPDELMPFDGESPDQYGIPAFHLHRAAADRALAAEGMGSLLELQEKLDAGGYLSRTLSVRARGQSGLQKESTSSYNVAGLLRGEGPRADELIVVGAHYDHLGIRRPMSRRFKAGKLVREPREPQIHNGADDNASGTGALIEIARMMMAGPKPNRSILFIAFTGEEAGLHGSKRYVELPLHPLNQTVAMLNMDMIGRMPRGSGKVTVFGADPETDLGAVVARAAAAIGIEIEHAVDSGGRSDHAPFVARKVPSLHFYTGSHLDYHQPTDDAHKINARGGAKITRLVADVATSLATQEARPRFQASRKKNEPEGTPSTFRVVMGLTPNYVDDGKKGMLVDAVSLEGPAETAGMQGGDRIVEIGGQPVQNIYDYMAATRSNKAGDTVTVVVARDGRERTMQVTLAPAR